MLLPLLTAGMVVLSLIVAGQFLLFQRAKRTMVELRAERAALREAGQRFNAVMDNAPIEIVLKDSEGRYVQVNRTWERLYGFTNEETVGKTVHDVLPEEFSIPLASNEKEVLKRGITIEAEECSPYPDGTIHDLLTIRFPTPGGAGKPAGLGLISTDITERKRTEQALRKSEKQLRTITDNLPVLIARLDKEKRFLFANRSAERWYGRPVSEIVGKTVPELFGKPVVEKVGWAVEASLSGEVVRFEESILYPDGVTRDSDIAYVPDRAENGDVQGYFALVQDISERKATEKALRKSEEQLRTVTDNLPAFICYEDRDERFLLVNRTVETWFDRPASEIIGARVAEFYDADNYAASRHHIEESDQDEIVRFEATLRFPDGIRRTVDVTYIPDTDEAGDVRGRFSFIQDVSERKQLEAGLFRNERLIAMGQLTGTVAHELRNPLGTIAMSLGVIGRKTAGAGLDLERALDRANRGMKRCETIITELLDFARARGLRPQLTPLDEWLTALVDEYELPENIHLSLDMQCDGLKVAIDRDGFHRAIINLLDNARDAMVSDDGGGAASHNLILSTRVAGERVEIIVTDDGSGIPADILPDIMEALFSTKSFGTGLGLPTVKRIVEEHGGGIEIESEVGQGAVVRLWVPRGTDSPEQLADDQP